MLRRQCLLLVLLWVHSIYALEFWIAPNGNDAGPGSRARPFGTLERARDAIRLAAPQQRAKPITVWLRGGDYFRTNALELGSADSGTIDAPICWSAWRNERVRLLGGRQVQGFVPVSDVKVLERLPVAARGHVLQVDLAALGIPAIGDMKSRGFGRPKAPAACELFFDHRPMTLARWPNEGEFARIAGYPSSADHKDEHGGNLGQLKDGFLYQGDRPAGWRDTSDIWVHGYWAYDWANTYEKVASLDVPQHLVKTAPPYGLYGFRKDQRFYFLNILEELDQPGEWFLDRQARVLYFWPPGEPGELQVHHEVLLSTLDEPLLKLQDVSLVTFRGLTLEATRGNAVEVRGGRTDRITRCLLRNIGDSAVVIDGGFGHGVVSCDVFDTGDAGVEMTGGDRQTLAPGGHFVENCHFQRQGRWSKCYVPAIAMTGVGLRASHNLIHDHPHCAILYWGNDHLIEYNEIHHVAMETGDVGAIYTGRDYTFRGNRVRYNFIHHTGGVGMGSMGVYMDDCVSGTEVFGNVFFKVHWAMFIGGGRDHVVENNLFVSCDPAVRVDGRGLDRSAVWRDMVNDTMRHSLLAVPAALYRERYPELKTLDPYYAKLEAFQGVPPENNRLLRNVCVGNWLEAGWHASPQMLQMEGNLTNAESSLVRMPGDKSSASDFELKPDSPAWALGFQRIPLSKIGLYQDDLRARVAQLAAMAEGPSDAVRPADSIHVRTRKPLYLYTLEHEGSAAAYDEAMAVASLQGLINRSAPQLYVLSHKNPRPQFWLDTLSSPGNWLQARDRKPISDLSALVNLAGTRLKGAIVWDPEVPATINVATTLAGIEDAVVLSPDFAARYLKEWHVPILLDLRGKFTGAETGSKKNDAYRWAIRELLAKGKCSSHLLCLFEDAFSTRGRGEVGYVVTRDWAIKNRAFVFDLSPWGDERPLDDPAQPMGTDLQTYKLLLSNTLTNSAGRNMTELTGFFAFSKYANMPDHKSAHEPVPTEWESVWLMSPFNCYQNTISSDCYNQSLHSQAPRGRLHQHPAEKKLPLEKKTYVCILMADYDSATPLYDFLPGLWQNPDRGKIPLAWGINPNLLETYPDLVRYYYQTATPADTFTSDASAAGYMNPNRVDKKFLSLFVKHNRKFFHEADMDIAPMILDWDQPSSEVKEAFRQFSPDGFATIVMDLHGNGGKLPEPQVWKGMPVTELINNACNFAGTEQTAKIMANAMAERGNRVPGFYLFRIVWVNPTNVIETLAALRRQRPDLDIQVLDPHTFFALFKQAQQAKGSSKHP